MLWTLTLSYCRLVVLSHPYAHSNNYSLLTDHTLEVVGDLVYDVDVEVPDGHRARVTGPAYSWTLSNTKYPSWRAFVDAVLDTK